MAFTYMEDPALESVLTFCRTVLKDSRSSSTRYQDRFLPSSKSQMLHGQFADPTNWYRSCMPAWGYYITLLTLTKKIGVIYSSQRDSSLTWTIEVQNHVMHRKPKDFADALDVANEEMSFVLMDLTTHAHGWLKQPMPALWWLWRIASLPFCHLSTRCQSAPTPALGSAITAGKLNITKSAVPFASKTFSSNDYWRSLVRLEKLPPWQLVKSITPQPRLPTRTLRFAEGQQTLPLVTDGYRSWQVAAIEYSEDLSEGIEVNDILD